MDFADSPAVDALRREVRAFLAEHYTPEMRERMHRTGTFHDRDLHRRIAARGWLEAALPGGAHERDPFELSALYRELELADAPYHGMATTMLVGGVLNHLAGDELKARVLPQILAGEAIVSLGYSEPDAGSDVAAVATRAVPAGDGRGWIVNGQKMWTTLAHVAQYVFLLTRTNPEVPKHRGLTMFLVPLDTPGITVQPVRTMGSDRTNVTYYDDVVVPDVYRVGDVDGGWRVMAVALGFERGVMGGTAAGVDLLHRVHDWAAAAVDDDGRPLLRHPRLREAYARTRINNEVAWLLGQRAAWVAASGGVPSIEGSVVKLFATHAYQQAVRAFQDLAGAEGLLRAGDERATAPEIERAARHAPVITIYGGTSEIQRNNIAERHLGLPSTRR